MIVVTGGAGFIGSNVVAALNERGRRDLLVVDDLTDGSKVRNLARREIADYLDKDDFAAELATAPAGARLSPVELVLHLGACTRTTETDGRYLLRNNYEWSRRLLAWCQARRVPLVYASSAAVYGSGASFREERACEAPRNAYAWSKLLFDEHVRSVLPRAAARIVGLRFFNVYGPGEGHKGAMASVVRRFHEQIVATGRVRLFRGSGGFGDGEQRRDFVHVRDVVEVALWAAGEGAPSGIFNVGTGRSRSFHDVARAVVAFHGRGEIEYVEMPGALRGGYQSFTEADLRRLREAGFSRELRPLEDGAAAYLAALASGEDG